MAKVKKEEIKKGEEKKIITKAEKIEIALEDKAQVEVETAIVNIEKTPTAVNVDESGTLVFKAKIPLTPNKHAALADMLRNEQKETGLNIILLPFSGEIVKENSEKARE